MSRYFILNSFYGDRYSIYLNSWYFKSDIFSVLNICTKACRNGLHSKYFVIDRYSIGTRSFSHQKRSPFLTSLTAFLL